MNKAVFAFAAMFALLAGCAAPEDAPPAIPKSQFPQGQQQEPVNISQSYPPAQVQAQTGLKIHFIDVGFGDSTLIQLDGHNILFDAGPAASASRITNYLSAHNVDKIDVLVVSSNASEHIGAIPSVAVYHLVEEIWDNGVNYTDLQYASIHNTTSTARRRHVEYGQQYEFGSGKITVLNPQKERYLKSSGPDSIALKVEYGDFCALLFSSSEGGGASGSDMGTVFGGIDTQIASGSVPISCPIIKIANYGSGNAASFQLLDRAKSELGIISVGPNQGARYPEPALLQRLLLKNISVLRTDEVGSIRVSSQGSGYSIYSER